MLAYVQDVKSMVRKLSNEGLRDYLISIGVGAIADTRSGMINQIKSQAKQNYKKQWKEQLGWDFDDCYNDELLRNHIEAQKEKGKKNARSIKKSKAAKQNKGLPV